MVPIKNGSPNIFFTGWDDQSRRAPVLEQEPLPIHYPLFFAFTQKGDESQVIGATGAAFDYMFGAESLNLRGKFATHATPYMTAAAQAANQMMVKRLKPTGAATATLQLCLDLLPVSLPIYERDANGQYVLLDGERIETGATTPGYKARWFLRELTGDVGATLPTQGFMVDGPTQSTLYPIHDVTASSFGEWGALLGTRFWSPVNRGLDPLDAELALEQKAYIYRFQAVQKPDVRSNPVILQTLASDPYVNFALHPDAINTNIDGELFIDNVLLPAYRDLDNEDNGAPAVGPFSNIYTYHENVATVLGLIHENEKLLTEELMDDDAQYLVNLYGAHNTEGAPYHTYELEGIMEDAPVINELTSHYLLGGDDGDVSLAEYNRLVGIELDFFGDLDVSFRDMARYPFSAFYDTGFPIDIKYKMCPLLGIRSDIHLGFQTHVNGAAPLSNSEESAMALAIASRVRLYPESIIYGTPTARAVVVGNTGKIYNSNYQPLVGGLYELFVKRCRYLGASNGRVVDEFSYTENPMNIITYLKDVTNTYKPVNSRNKDWDNGLIWIQSFDTKRNFMPQTQTVYMDDTSILNSDMNMQICVEANKVCFRVWRQLTGNDNLTEEQLIERSNTLIEAEMKDKFGTRIQYRADTLITRADNARGYSWTTHLHIYGNVPWTVNVATVITHRMEDLLNEAA